MDRDDLTGDEPLRALDNADQAAVDQLLTSARMAAAQTFGPFNDASESPFYAAEDTTPQQTWERIAEHVTLATTAAVAHGAARRPISTTDVSRLHKIVFETTFPDDAGRLRERGEEAQYGIVIGTRERPIPSHARATASVRVPVRLEKACREFNNAVEALEGRDTVLLDELVFVAVRLYAKVLSIHPFRGRQRPDRVHAPAVCARQMRAGVRGPRRLCRAPVGAWRRAAHRRPTVL